MVKLNTGQKYRSMSPTDLRAARANRVFGTDKRRIRTKNTVMDKSNNGFR
jgi:hypothetical protein